MAKTVMVVGSETLLGRKLIEVYLNAGYKVAAPVMTEQESMKESGKKNLLVIPWNRSSLVSAKTVIRETLRSFGSMDLAVAVNPEISRDLSLDKLETEESDELLYTYIHGTLYLLKEVISYFNGNDKGTLAFAETEKGLSAPGTIPMLIQGAFHNLSESVLLSENTMTGCCAFTSRLTEMEDYAQFIKGILETGDSRINGEWLQFSDRKNLFQSLPLIKRK